MTRPMKIVAIATLLFLSPLVVPIHQGMPVGSAYAQGGFGRKTGTADKASQEAKAAEDAKKAAEAEAADDARKAAAAKAADDAKKAAAAKAADDAKKAAAAKAADDAKRAAAAKAADDAKKVADAKAADDARKAAAAKPAGRVVDAVPTPSGRKPGGDTSKYDRVANTERPVKPAEPAERVETIIYYPVEPVYNPTVIIIEPPVVVQSPTPEVVVQPVEPRVPTVPQTPVETPVPLEPTVVVQPVEPSAPQISIETAVPAAPVPEPAVRVITDRPSVHPAVKTVKAAIPVPKSAAAAVKQIRLAWLQNKPQLLRPLLPGSGTIKILRNGKYLRRLKPADYYKLAAGDIEKAATKSFSLSITRKVKTAATAKGTHTYRGADGKLRKTSISYTLALKSGRWVITQTGFRVAPAARPVKSASR